MEGNITERTPLMGTALICDPPRDIDAGQGDKPTYGLAPHQRKLSRAGSAWVLKANVEAEELTIGQDGICSFQVSNGHGCVEEAPPKLIKYSGDVGTFKALWHVSGTVLVSSDLWRTVAVYWCIAAVCSVAAFLSQLSVLKNGTSFQDFSESFETMANYFTALIGFMISMFVTTLFGRWWSIRTDGIGGLWGAVDNLLMILSIHMPDREDRPVKERILRLGLLSHRLIYAQAQNLESREHLQKLKNVGLMTADELDILDQEVSKPQVVWVWIGQIIHALAAKGKIKHQRVMLPKLDKLVMKARGSIGLIFAYTDTQVPYAYVHLLVLSILFSNCLIALKCGLAIGFSMGGTSAADLDAPHALKVMVQLCHLSVIPFFYHAFVHIGLELANPLETEYMCFPGLSFHVWMRDENMSFVRAGEKTPESLLEV